MKHPAYRKARLAIALLLAAAVGLAACGRGAGTQVAGADQQVIYGYVLEVNEQARTVTVDPVELVAAEDVQRLNRLGLEATLSGRSYAYNARRNYVMYALDRAAEFDFGDEDGAAGEEKANLSGNGQSGDGAAGDGGGLMGGGLTSDDGLLNRNNAGAAANRANSEAGNTGEPGGNSVSGNTSVGNGTAADTSTDAAGSSGSSTGTSSGAGQSSGGSINAGPYADGGSAMGGPGYGYTAVRGGLFTGLNDRFDRLNAYIKQYDDLLCRLVLENGAVTKITVCTGDNL